MESLLLVLLVIGVVMILAGLARMRNKQRQAGGGDIDHSVLFNKDQGEVTDLHMRASAPDPLIKDELAELGGLVAADAGETAEHTAPAHEPRATEARDTSRPVQTSFSFLGRSRRDDGNERDAATPAAPRFFKDDAPQWVIVLNVVAPNASPFPGPALLSTLEALGLTFGDMNIFHFKKNGVPQFSVVNMVKPGTFNMTDIERFTTPGLSLFVQLPNDHGSAMTAYNHMLDTAHQIAAQLEGAVLDERRSVLTTSAVDHVREKIVEYELKWRVAD